MRRHPLLTCGLAVLTLLAFTSPAMASKKTVEIEITNDANRESMYCKLYRQVRVSGGKMKWQFMDKYNVGADDKKTFRAKIPPRVKTLSGKYYYPKIKLFCNMPKNNHGGKKESKIWDPSDKSFDSHRFEVYGRYSSPTSISIRSR